MGRKSKKEGIYVYIWFIHFAVQQKLTHFKAIILQYKLIKKRNHWDEYSLISKVLQ